MNTNIAEFRWVSNTVSLRYCDLDERSLNIGRVKLATFNLDVSSIDLFMSNFSDP